MMPSPIVFFDIAGPDDGLLRDFYSATFGWEFTDASRFTVEIVDLIFDVPGNHPLSACRRALEPDGKYVLIGHEGYDATARRWFGLFPRFFGLILRSLFVRQLRLGRSSIPDRKEAMAILRELLEAGKITPVIDSSYPLSRVREAFRHMIEDEPAGKVILTV